MTGPSSHIVDINSTIRIEPAVVLIFAIEWGDNGWVISFNGRPMGATMPKDKAEVFAEYLAKSLPDILEALAPGSGAVVMPATTLAVLAT